MKTLRIASSILVVLALLIGFGAVSAAAQGPVASAAPVNAPYIDNQSHALQPNASALYRFDYNSDSRPVTTITLLNGNANGMSFEVWTPDTVTDMPDNKPIGVGSTFSVACDSGTCTSPDLIWSGAFGASGPYYVRVINNTSTTATAQLMITGDGVSLAPTTSPVAVTGPNASTQPPANVDDPAKAVTIDGSSKTIAANSVQWYSFNYGLNDDGSRPTRLLTLVNGNQSGVSFQVYSPDLLNDWWQNTPTGAGTPGMVACDTGTCTSNDLTWLGAFGAPGTYYVRVINSTNNPFNAMLTIQ